MLFAVSLTAAGTVRCRYKVSSSVRNVTWQGAREIERESARERGTHVLPP